MIAMLVSPPRFISKANTFPSGDQLGQPTVSLSNVNCRGVPPSTATVQTLIVPLFVELKAICFPSGESLMKPIDWPGSRRSLSLPVLTERDQIPPLPSRSEQKAIVSLSGNQVSPHSTAVPLVSCVAFRPSGSITQILGCSPPRNSVKPIFLPS